MHARYISLSLCLSVTHSYAVSLRLAHLYTYSSFCLSSFSSSRARRNRKHVGNRMRDTLLLPRIDREHRHSRFVTKFVAVIIITSVTPNLQPPTTRIIVAFSIHVDRKIPRVLRLKKIAGDHFREFILPLYPYCTPTQVSRLNHGSLCKCTLFGAVNVRVKIHEVR